MSETITKKKIFFSIFSLKEWNSVTRIKRSRNRSVFFQKELSDSPDFFLWQRFDTETAKFCQPVQVLVVTQLASIHSLK